jgi:catechol 2,3-dioxygenase-like lactoylglutathione lyase family enzyme
MPDSATPVRKFHLSVNVSDLARSVAFYEVLFGKPPEKHHADYAKFALEDPPAVFSLVPGRSGQGGALNHVGLCLLTAEELVAIQHRLEAAGHKTLREDGVACCYSRQTKFWVRDPDGILLELYIFHGDLEDDDDHDHRHAGGDLPTLMGGGKEDEPAPTVSWTHQLGTPLEAAAALETNSHQEIILEGSINDSLDLAALLREARRALKPGGKISLHGLAADRELEDASPSLPGPAAAVKKVPDLPSLASLLQTAGFSNIKFTKLSERGYFQHEGVPLREVLIEAVKPGFRPSAKNQQVVYLGPQSVIEDDFGNRFERGKPTPINIHDWQALKKSASSSFVLLDSAVQPIVCGNDQIDL